MTESLQRCERDVERARSRLEQDLAILRSPSTVSSFTDTLKHEALDAKDAVVEQAKQAVQTKVADFVEDLKAKAAANPAAALAIGAGIAWQFIRNPPIATALIGAGLVSLFRANGTRAYDDAAYLRQGKTRLKQQVGELRASAMNAASDVQSAVSAKANEMLDSAKDKAQGWMHDANETAGVAGDAIKDQAGSFASAVRHARDDLADRTADAVSAVRRGRHELGDQASSAATRVASAADRVAQGTLTAGQKMISDNDTRDKVLLGVAGLAVAAALGVAYQKRVLEDAE